MRQCLSKGPCLGWSPNWFYSSCSLGAPPSPLLGSMVSGVLAGVSVIRSLNVLAPLACRPMEKNYGLKPHGENTSTYICGNLSNTYWFMLLSWAGIQWIRPLRWHTLKLGRPPALDLCVYVGHNNGIQMFHKSDKIWLDTPKLLEASNIALNIASNRLSYMTTRYITCISKLLLRIGVMPANMADKNGTFPTEINFNWKDIFKNLLNG